ncbi:hypothetical protein Dda_8916 [Drechslerella dactyloides]|uniref:Uncharacterized protein n=1 Tax=Drechslerella dactyloides TaxID=74499 RepID=A0AAD6IQ54_DREDA|nr:hypothetical protein Dda_8916 [Drechslerella dactyloides]
MDKLSVILIAIFSTLVVLLAAAVTYLVLYRKVTFVPQTTWSSTSSTYTVRQRRPFAELFSKFRRKPKPAANHPARRSGRRGSDAWDDNISEEELGILRPTHSRAPSDPFQDPAPYDPYTPSAYTPASTHGRSFSHNSTLSIPSSNRDLRNIDYSDDEYEDSSLPHYAPPVAAPSTPAAYHAGTSTPSTTRFTPTSSPPHQSPPPSIIHHIDSFRQETLETTLTDIRLTLDSANTILTQVADLSSLPDESDSLLTPADLAKINELSSQTTYHTDLLDNIPSHPEPLDTYTARLPKFKTLVAQGMAIIMAAESRRTRVLSGTHNSSSFSFLSSGSTHTLATTPTTPGSRSVSTSTLGTPRPQEVKRTQLLSRYADLKKTERFARNSLRQILERREARRGSPGSENREMELEVRMLGLRAFRERVALARKLGVTEDDPSEDEESWGLHGVDGEVGGERVPSGTFRGRRIVQEHVEVPPQQQLGMNMDEEDPPVPLPPPPAYEDDERDRERRSLLDSKELQ